MTFRRKTVHFIGIGGAGMSAIAKVLLEQGAVVSGSDLKRSSTAMMLEALGAEIYVGHDAAHVTGKPIVVVSSAIPRSNPELVAAHREGARVISRGQALAEVLRGRRSIIVAGTHGKTTTTSMIITILRSAGLDPTYLVGGELNDVGTNGKHGRDELAVAESDESDGSFLLLDPAVAVVTNLEVDHLDYWKSFENLAGGFRSFLSRVQPGGVVCVPAGNELLKEIVSAQDVTVHLFGEGGDVVARDVRPGGTGSEFVLVHGADEAPVALRVPGSHNVANALAAAAACLAVGLDIATIAGGLAGYRGVQRRFQVRGTAAGVTVIDDYAHLPTEITVTLAAARPGPWRRVVAVFQPHRYSRMTSLSQEFGSAFSDADQVVVTDVYGAGESPVPGITGKLVADAVCAMLPGRPVAYLPRRADLVGYLIRSSRPGDAVFTLGAGDVSTVGEELLARLGDRP